jgi:transforming growth factor-beta-induced protein
MTHSLRRKPIYLVALIAALGLTLSACREAPIEQDPFNVFEILQEIPQLSIMAGLVVDAGLSDRISQESPITFFAPINDAFAAIDLELYSSEEIAEIVLYHVANESRRWAQLSDGLTLTTLQGESVNVFISGQNQTWVNESEMVAIDGIGTNGVVHVMAGVLIPPSFEEEEENGDED